MVTITTWGRSVARPGYIGLAILSIVRKSEFYGLLAVLASSLFSYYRGQDFNFDQLNYHIYIPYALLNDRIGKDIAPAAIQSYFNPTPYLPFYWLVRHTPPRCVGLIMGALHGLNYWLLIALARRLTRNLTHRDRLYASIAAVLIAVASPMALSEIGTSFADILLSPLVLGGLLLLARAAEKQAAASQDRCLFAAAFLLGAAASLKLTFAPYAIGFAATSIAGGTNWRSRLRTLAVISAGIIAGFALVGGAWYARIWAEFGNPFFPYYNAIFKSPDYPFLNIHDELFKPKSFFDGLSYPFRWTIGQPVIGSHVPWRDMRFVLLFSVFGVFAALKFLAWRRRLHLRSGKYTWTTAQRQLVVFFFASFVVWLYEFGIQRYAVPLGKL